MFPVFASPYGGGKQANRRAAQVGQKCRPVAAHDDKQELDFSLPFSIIVIYTSLPLLFFVCLETDKKVPMSTS